MTWLSLLTKDERQEAADAIDCILDFLGLSVRKADPLEEKLFGRWAAHVEASEASIAKVEAMLEKLLLESWSVQAQKAIKEAAKVVELFSGPLTQDEVQLIVAAVAKAMGPDFASLTTEEATRLVGTAYLLGRKVTAQAIGLKPKLAVIDEAARTILTEHTVFWIGQHYDAALGGEIAGIVRELALESGLGRAEVGKRLKEALGGVFPKSDVYWRGLAATTVTRARALGAVQSLVEAEVEEYEIMAMLDERTCELCTHLNGKTFRTEHAVALRDALLEANTPEDVKRIHPWRTLKEIKNWDEEKLAESGMALPPYHFHCFPPGTMVLTIRGPRPIEQITEGDLVLTHRGRWKPVAATMVRSYEGELVVVNGRVASTIDHPYLAATTNGIEWLPATCLGNCSLLQVVLQSQWKPGGESHDQQDMSDVRQGISGVSIPQPCEVLFPRVPESSESEGGYRADQGETVSSCQSDPSLPAMREGIPSPREPGAAGQRRLLQQRVQGQSSGHQDYTGLRGLWETVPEEQGLFGQGLWEVLLPGLSEQSQERGKTLQVERRDQNRQERLYIRVSSGSPLCEQPRICAATSSCNGEVVGAVSRSGRSGSSQERHSDRQQTGELDAFSKQLGALRIPQGATYGFQWTPVISLEKQHYRGPVYNLEVEDDESYFANGFAVHNCRCTYVAKTFKEVEGKPLAIEFPSLQPKSTIPDVDALRYAGSGAYLGGAGEKHIYEDASGNKYIFKPAVSKSGVSEPFRAYVQEAASQIAARLYEPGEFVEIKAMTLRGRLGTVQPLLSGVKGNLKSIKWQSLAPDVWKQIQREHVLDWVVGNFDSHAGNFIYLEGGRVLGIDKEQAFRYLYDPKSWKMSLDYHPNAVYGEQEPLYNTLYRAFAQNKIDLDLQAVLPVLQRLERISDDEYRAILRPYAEALKGKGAAAEDLLDRAVKRKHEVRECYREFFTKLLKMRDPHFKGTFKFLDEMSAQDLREASLAAKVLSKAELQAMDVASLKKLAKAQKIPYYYYLTKAELVEVLSDPDQLTAVTVAARDRARARLRAARGARQALAPAAGDVLEDLGRATARGVSVRKDKDVLEGQQLNVRRIEDDGRPGFELTCKLTQEYHDKVRSALRRLGGTRDDYLFYGGKLTSTHFGFTRSRYEFAGRAMVLNLPDAEVVFADDANRRALLGQLTIRVYGNDGVTSAQRLKQIFSDLGLDMLAQDPTPEDDRLFRLSRLAWQHAPQEEIRTRRAGRTAAELEDILRRKGIDPARAGKLVEREVWPGYRTFVEEGAASRYKALGAEYLFAGVDDAESVVRILSPDSPGLMSTCERYRFGIFKGGASPGSDIGTGGADSAFARLVPRNARGKRMFRESYKGGGYRLIIDVAELDRADWYAYGHDAFGITYRDFERRPAAEEFVQRLNREYRPNNEVMFRKGIRKESIIGITCDSYYMRDTLLQEFRRAGIMEVNGRKIEDFIKVQEMV